ncbi:DUF6882 domain-containing protein [Zobellia uliginosa]|uniref:DUF6882 domain-containing protein n=1 Tax=Zobellia uliginosa TaxID=143224 RepID=UPI0026E3A830|nr:DUF6882 domain-containing protein [Zobellia uliginosa]MDO6516589.1 hypothetical protein [Zobellia uliginosa]
MGILDHLFGGKKQKGNPKIDSSTFKVLEKTDYKNFEEAVGQNAGLSFEKQMIFGDVIGSKAWELDMGKGKIMFDSLEFPIQIIGSLSFNDNSWMWAWANTQSGMPENLLIQSNQLKAIGEEKHIEELTDPHFNVEEGFEHKIGMMVCGLFGSKSYYCANYGQGSLVVTIDDDKIPGIDKNNFEKIMSCFPQLISGMELNHKTAFMNYLIDREFQLAISEDKVEGLRNGKVVVAEFDELNRLKSLKGKI